MYYTGCLVSEYFMPKVLFDPEGPGRWRHQRAERGGGAGAAGLGRGACAGTGARPCPADSRPPATAAAPSAWTAREKGGVGGAAREDP